MLVLMQESISRVVALELAHVASLTTVTDERLPSKVIDKLYIT
jgi:hypothetical protein